jgi:hypothetical protein
VGGCLGGFHTLQTLDSHQYSCAFGSNHLLPRVAMFFCDFWSYFWPNFVSRDLRRFSSIPSMDLGAKVSLIIYLHSWSESMDLAPLIWRISLGFPKS